MQTRLHLTLSELLQLLLPLFPSLPRFSLLQFPELLRADSGLLLLLQTHLHLTLSELPQLLQPLFPSLPQLPQPPFPELSQFPLLHFSALPQLPQPPFSALPQLPPRLFSALPQLLLPPFSALPQFPRPPHAASSQPSFWLLSVPALQPLAPQLVPVFHPQAASHKPQPLLHAVALILPAVLLIAL